MTVRTLNDCRLVIVIFSSSCVKNDGRRREGNRGGYSALAGLKHLVVAGDSSHIIVAAGSQDSFWERGKNRDRNRDVKCVLFKL